MKIDCVVFDLDGTLVSSHETIYNSTIAAMNQLGIKGEIPKEKFKSVLGHHFVDMFRDFGIELPDFEKFIAVYKSLYFDFIDSSYLYPGVIETLEFLKERNIKTAMLTTKAQDQAEKIAEYFKLNWYLDYVMGRRNGIANKPSAEPLEIILKELNVDKSSAMMVGDTELDIRCGKNAGTKTCAVTYGYRTIEELKNEKPDFLIYYFAEVFKVVTDTKI